MKRSFENERKGQYNHSGLGTVTVFLALLTAGFILFNLYLVVF